jgi:hypothetical protein
MDVVQQQIVTLSQKIDRLYQMVEQLSYKISAYQAEPAQGNAVASSSLSDKPRSYRTPSLLDSVMEHKDVLLDGDREIADSQQNQEKGISADIQVQRLTAQLTAAYNRIAALEEQLLSRRIHS